MSTDSTAHRPGRRAVDVHWRDYLDLCKLRVVALMLLTSVIGMCMALSQGFPSLRVLLLGNLGIGLCACSAAALNHLIDRRTDAKMQRTRGRPLPQQRIDPASVLVFALVLGTLGALLLFWQINTLTAWLTLISLFGYALVYTVWLKPSTPLNIVIGGLAGATPPLLGWTAVTGTVQPQALLMVLIIFTWTPVHFWALALHKKEEYAAAAVPMLPVTHGEQYTRVQILLYMLLLLAVSLLPFVVGMSGWPYLAAALILGAGYIYRVLQLFFSSAQNRDLAAFNYSNWYLGLLFGAMLLDHYLPGPGIT